MPDKIIDKKPLDEITHSVRAVQAVMQYGVGAMVDFPDQTLVTAAPEYWTSKRKIFDDRFTKALGVKYFALPTDISYARFPEWYFCPKCRKFQTLDQWIKDYQKKAKSSELEWNEYMIKKLQCPSCHQDLVVARVVTICEKGHLNDFPWVNWVHAKSKKPICSNPELKFKTGTSASEGLDGVTIECSCGARATLKGAFDKDCFKNLDEELGTNMFRCEGNHPFKHSKEECSCYPKTVQRGASSVYFPVVYSSLVIPPYADKLNVKIERSSAFDDCIVNIEDEDPEDRINKITKRLPKWVSKIALEIGENEKDIEHILRKKWLDTEEQITAADSIQYRMEEYTALSGEVNASVGTKFGDFSRIEMNINDYDIPHLKSISLIDKVRVVKALIGFSRITPVNGRDEPGYVEIKEDETSWYPAYEVRGEGIFIEFDQRDIDKWIAKNPSVLERANHLNENYKSSYVGKSRNRVITPKFIMLHTLSHLLISQLSFECGYSVASLAERIYCSEKEDGKEMAGIFIYTASGDSEGTLGGLVRQGRPDTLPRIIKKAISKARTCSNDPVCIMSRGQGRESLNMAACHSCTLLPETCCEEGNSLLDRGLLIGSWENPEIGFWDDSNKDLSDIDVIEGITSISESVIEIRHEKISKKKLNYAGDDKLSFEGCSSKILELNDEWLTDEKIRNMILELSLYAEDKKYECPLIDKKIIADETIWPDLFWPKSKVAVFLPDNNEQYKKMSEYDWYCYNLSDNIAPEIIFKHILEEE